MLAHSERLEQASLLRRDAHHALGSFRFSYSVNLEDFNLTRSGFQFGRQLTKKRSLASAVWPKNGDGFAASYIQINPAIRSRPVAVSFYQPACAHSHAASCAVGYGSSLQALSKQRLV